MANVSKIKLPDNSTLDIIDSRISSVDSSISSSSSGVVTNSTIAAEFDKVAYIGDTIDSATYTDSGIVIDVSNKADKVTNATSGNFAALDANGNLTDSGHKSSDYQTTLISGTNIKTINNESLLGSGNITIGAGGSGTVTSVGMTVPTGLSVSGSPITSNGTLAVSLASGYEIPQSNAIVHKAGTETITGDKTFVGVQTFDDCVVNLDSGSELNNLTATDFSWLTTNDGSGSYKTLQSELNNKQDALVSGTNIKTINNNSILGSGNINIQGGGITSGTWSEIKSLRDGHALVPGTWYRITNYCATTSQSYTSSAEVYFDILLLATSEDTFSEEAKAAMNSDWESEYDYFSSAGSNLDAWKIWYCIDNDMDRFGWAHNNGKGVIYRMIDEFGNDCPYDFKGIKFIINSTRHASDWMNTILGSTNQVGVFTFDAFYSYPSSPYDQDASVWNQNDFGYDYSQYGATARIGIINNKIEPAYDATNGTFRVQILNGNVFVDSDRSTLFAGFQENVLRQNCTENVFGSGATGNILNIGCHKNYFFDFCRYNFLDANCELNWFIHESQGNKFGPGCHDNSSYYSMNNVILGSGCCLNTFGGASDCKLGSECSYISLYHNENIVFEKECNNINIPENSYSIKFAPNCHHIDFGRNGLHDIVFKFPTYYIHFNDNWSNVQIENLGSYNGTSSYWSTFYGMTSLISQGSWHFGIVGGSGCDFYRDTQFSDYVVYSGYDSNQFLCTPSANSGSVSLRKLKYNDLPEDFRFELLPEEKRPLTFKILTGGTITWRYNRSSNTTPIQTIQYSKNGNAWSNLTATLSGAAISVAAGDTLVFKGSNWPGTGYDDYMAFGGTATFDVYGNPASLKYGTNLTDIETIANYCYSNLFRDCTGIRKGPILPSKDTSSSQPYYEMFQGCTNLKECVVLRTSSWGSYMFSGCVGTHITVPGSYSCFGATTSVFPKECFYETTSHEVFIKSSANWSKKFLKRSAGGTEYTTKADAISGSGLAENVFDALLNGELTNASLLYHVAANPYPMCVAKPNGYYSIQTSTNAYDKEVYWSFSDLEFGISYDSTTGYYYLYGNADMVN